MESARLQQVSNADQLFMIRLNDKKCLIHSVVGGRLAIRGDRDHPSARFEDAPGTLQRVPADSVEYDVHSRDVFLKVHGSVVNHLFGSQPRYEVKVSRGRGSCYTRATKSG
jgi:hypothetical protein